LALTYLQLLASDKKQKRKKWGLCGAHGACEKEKQGKVEHERGGQPF
jgi:hypothetical protein